MNQVVHHLIAAWGWRNMLRFVGGIILIISVPCVSTFSQPFSKNPVLTDSVAPPDEEEERKDAVESIGEEKTVLQEEKQRLKAKEAEAEEDREDDEKQGRCDRLRNIAYPELWFMAVGIMAGSMTLTFYLISMVSFMTTQGYEKSDCTMFMMMLALSEVVGKVLISAVADILPFPKIYLFVVASLCGVGVMVMLLFANSYGMMLGLAVVAGLLVMSVFDTLPYSICVEVFGSAKSLDTSAVLIITSGVGLILGSLLGMSVDHSGNFNSAIFACIGIYSLCVLLFIAVPIYQRLFAKERYVMVRNRRKALLMESDGPERTFDPSPLPSPEYVYLDIVSVV